MSAPRAVMRWSVARWSARGAALAALVLVLALACGGGAPSDDAAGRAGDAAAAAGAASPPASLPAPPGRPRLTVAPRQGPPGTDVTLTLGGLLSNQKLDLSFGDFTQNEVIAQADADADGNLSAVTPVPAGARPGTHYFIVSEHDGSPIAVSDSFVVTAGP